MKRIFTAALAAALLLGASALAVEPAGQTVARGGDIPSVSAGREALARRGAEDGHDAHRHFPAGRGAGDLARTGGRRPVPAGLTGERRQP